MKQDVVLELGLVNQSNYCLLYDLSFVLFCNRKYVSFNNSLFSYTQLTSKHCRKHVLITLLSLLRYHIQPDVPNLARRFWFSSSVHPIISVYSKNKSGTHPCRATSDVFILPTSVNMKPTSVLCEIITVPKHTFVECFIFNVRL